MEIDPRRLVAQLAVAVIVADGRVTTGELEELGLLDCLGLGRLSGLAEEEMRNAVNRPIDVRAACGLLREQLPDAAPTILGTLAAIAAADEDVSEPERKLLAEVASELGLAPAEAERILAAVFQAVGLEAPPEPAAPPPYPAGQASVDPRLSRALLVLGLGSLTGRADLDASYRRHVERYDPAKVLELGPDFAALAVRKLAEVTDAYQLAVDALSNTMSATTTGLPDLPTSRPA
jgi:DnaJ-domain-containing protein 1